MRVLITGGTGVLGRHVARELLASGDVPVLAGRSLDRIEPSLASNVETVSLDLRDHAAVLRACQGVEAVVHAGAVSTPWGRSLDLRAVNVGGTASVIAGCHRYGVRRLVYVSSPSVVFDGRDVIGGDETAPYPARFTSTYALTKKLGEDLVNQAAVDLETVILRPKALFGPGDRTLLPRLLSAAARRRLPVIGSGRNLVDLTFVENAALATALAVRSSRANGRTYTITNGEPVVLWDVIRRVLRELGCPPPGPRLPLHVALLVGGLLEKAAERTGREPPLTRYTALILARTQTYTITAARRELGYVPRVPVDEGIERTIAALKAERGWIPS